MEQKKKFETEKFVEFLLDEGAKVSCDQNVESLDTTLPHFYNEELFKKGQLVYEKHKFALNFAMLMGLIAGLAIPFFRNVLSLTKMSSTPSAAGERYKITIAHVNVWYQGDFTPGSRLWKSIAFVRSRHIAGNAQLRKAKRPIISQRDMGLTLSGFFGFSLIRRQKIGLHNVSDEDWKALIHIWRVIGHLMGIEDRFNICRESVEETTDIIDTILEKIVAPLVEKFSGDYVFMVTNLVDGFVKPFSPSLITNILLAFLCKLSQKDENSKLINLSISLTLWEKIMLSVIKLQLAILRFNFFRFIQNYFVSNLLIKFSHFLTTSKYHSYISKTFLKCSK